MKKLNPPPYSLEMILPLCANSVRDTDLGDRLLGSLGALSLAEAAYRELGRATELYTIPASPTVNGQVSLAEMEGLYSKTFVRKSGPTRKIYEAIRADRKSVV